MSFLEKINSIKQEALFEHSYQKGLLKLEKMEEKCGDKNYFLLAEGVLSDHLAMISKNKKKEFYQKKAIAVYRKVIEKDPENLKAYYGLGRIELHQGNFDKGLKWYKKALEIKPNARFNKLAYATALFWARKYKKAEQIFLADYKEYGSFFQTAYNLALVEEELKNNKKKIFFAREALRLWKKKPKKIRKSEFGKLWEARMNSILIKTHA